MIKNTIEDEGRVFKIKLMPNIKNLNEMIVTLPILFGSDSKNLMQKYFSCVQNEMGYVEVFMFGIKLYQSINMAKKGHYANSKGQIICSLDDDKPELYFGDSDGNFVSKYSLSMEDNGLIEYNDIVLVDPFNPYDLKSHKYLTYKVESKKVPGLDKPLMDFTNVGWSEGDILLKSVDDKERILSLYNDSISMEDEINIYKNSLLESNPGVIFGEDARRLGNKNRFTIK